jgi:hypothetical protein
MNMARPVERRDIVDYQTYAETRAAVRERMYAIKAVRRVHLGEALTFLFENTDTIRYQIQEMMRAEQIVREAAIQHEIDTYNELLGGPGEIGCSLLIEIDDPSERAAKLHDWIDLPRHLYVRLADGRRVHAQFDPRQVGTDRLSAVQYLRFPVGTEVPVAVGTDLPALAGEQELTAAQRDALATDLLG